MIRRRDASRDGWFWGGASSGKPPDDSDPFPSENGFGLSCLRCHAAAENQSTFSTLDNIAGFGGEPLPFRVERVRRKAPLGGCNGKSRDQSSIAVARDSVLGYSCLLNNVKRDGNGSAVAFPNRPD